MRYIYYYDTDIGRISIAQNESAITGLYFPGYEDKALAGAIVMETELLRQAGRQLKEYFSGTRKAFDLPLEPAGTPFQQRVWKALKDIPYGEVRTYKDIATAIGDPKACRAVGMANNKNPIAIIIPCHRVIGSNGKLIGYGGGLHIKQYLLELEKGN
ncbi:MAG TPA: methylated-DNA--[protein]-cysteine S-methyltransferase [Candidatus Atribacteria bacterium]|nr:methylated-DNA--[protein]-cysteine S-methyltransferase [Candidatus Atribacteria bacterium]HPT77976.1 methylated-DNA--[protein]-cysteine S-methyltransferase [Candidatus Atribacteria bacterium]